MTENHLPSGPPKRKDRQFITAMIGAVTVAVLALITFVFISDFPGPPEGDPAHTPPGDVRR